MFSLALLLAACDKDRSEDVAVFSPPEARLHRLTDVQYRESVLDLFGVAYTGDLPADYVLYGYSTIGSSEASLAPLELEQVETAAWAVAETAVRDSVTRDGLVGCTLGAPLGDVAADATTDELCLHSWLLDIGQRAWRRPMDGEEVVALIDLYNAVGGVEDPTLGVQAVVASLLLSPHFLYRVEIGENDPEHPGQRRLSGWELATRLAYFVTNAPPDSGLLLAAEDGSVHDPGILLGHVDRLLDSERGREAATLFFDETMDLYKLALVSKDATLFPELTDAARAAMREEIRLIFQQVVLDEAQPVNALFITPQAYVNAALAPIYQVGATGDELVPMTFGDDIERGGILGRAAFLTINANATFNSPTRRGKWVRTRLLCQDIPAPPPGVAAIEEADTNGTLRDQLEQHMTDPTCESCHRLMDPIGFGFEYYDPIGRRQDLDNGLPIDATGDIDDVTFDGAESLGAVVANHPNLGWCFSRNLYRWAKGELDADGEQPAVSAIADAFDASGLDYRALVRSIVLSEGFTRVAAPGSEACDAGQEGRTRACASDCGEGLETCQGGSWTGCTAPVAGVETCDGLDNDCDGMSDEYVARPCETDGLPGVQECLSSQWQACDAIPSDAETCNGIDDDGDGSVDEDLAAFLETVTEADLVTAHESCAVSSDSESGGCHAAIHRYCAATGCGVSGPNVVDRDNGLDAYALACFDSSAATVISTTFSELGGYHSGCSQSNTHSPDCNAAINRYCGASGLGTGYGPVEHSGDGAAVVCTPTAVVYETTYSTLVGFNPACDGSTERKGYQCHEAFHRYCQSMGYRTGFGPLENSGDVAYAACVGVL